MRAFITERDKAGRILCLPEDLDRGDLIEITTMSDRHRKFLSESTGKLHDCAVYNEELVREYLKERTPA